MKGKVIAVGNQKGGVGKTTVTVNLAAGLVKKGKKVICIDTDSQGSLGACLGIEMPDDLDYSLKQILECIISDKEYDLDKAIIHQEEGLDIIPGNIELQTFEMQLINVVQRELVLKELTDQLKKKYDYIIIDCPGYLGVIFANDLTCADSIIIPVRAEKLSVKGLQQLFRFIGRVHKTTNKRLKVEGVVFNMVKKNTNYFRFMSETIRNAYGSTINIFDTFITESTKVSEQPESGTSIFKYSPRSKSAKQYHELIEEVIENEQ